MRHVEPVEFRLLGPFGVLVGGRPVEVGSPKVKALLAVLLLQAGRVVSVSELADSIWGDAQPDNPRRAVQVLVARLRAVMRGVGLGPVISTRASGYSIEVSPDRVDLGQFQSWLADADRAVGRGDLEGEAAALEQALAVWRGEPLVDVPSERLQGETLPRLREQRLEVLERRIEVDLRRGRQAELVGELSGLTAQYPWRERLWGQLMRALNGSGRRAEALDAYHTLRRHLAEELGIEPGEELQSLHASILAGRHHGGGPHVVPVPRQLPPDVPGFVGRADQIAQLSELLEDAGGASPGLVVIAGMAGVGKTALAVHWARRLADRFPDGQLWVNLRGFDPDQALPPAGVLAQFLRAFGVAGERIPVELAELTGLYRSLLDGRQVLVVLDNANAAEQIRPLLPGSPGCLVVVTSRHQLPGLVAADAARLLRLDPFTTGESRRLLAHRLGHSRVAAEPQAVDQIIGRCARLPLALAVAAALAAAHPDFELDKVAAGLADGGEGLQAFAAGDPAVDVRDVFSWSYRALTPHAARLFRLLSLHPGPDIATAAAGSLAGIATPQARQLLAELTRAHLLTEHAAGRYSFHDLLRAYAIELARNLDPAPEQRTAEQRVLDHYVYTVDTAARLLHPHRRRAAIGSPAAGVTPEVLTDYHQALAWFTAEYGTLLASIRHAVARGFDVHACQIGHALINFMDLRGYWRDWITTQHTVIDAARRLGDQASQALAHCRLAVPYARAGQPVEAVAHLQQAVDLYGEIGDRAGQAYTHLNMALVVNRQARYGEELHHAQQALDILLATDDRFGQALAFNAVGVGHAELGHEEQAITHCRRSLTVHQELNDRHGQANAWDSLGFIHHRFGHYQQATACYWRALDLARELGHRDIEHETLTRLGDSHAAAGQTEDARLAWQQALDILVELDHPRADQVRARLYELTREEADRRPHRAAEPTETTPA